MNETIREEIKAVRELVASINRPNLTLEETRRLDEEQTANLPLPEGATVKPVIAGGVKGEWVCAAEVRDNAALFYLHGGAYVFCSCADRARCYHLCKLRAAVIVAVIGGLTPHRPN